MQHKQSTTAGLIALGVAAFSLLAAPASAQVSTTANGPYYATPSWDQKLTTNRFVKLANWNNEAVLDRETGLVWEQSPDSTQRDWPAAHNHCANRVVGSRMGWRLPSIEELSSLVDPTVDPALPAGHPFGNVQSVYSNYFSATSHPTDATLVRVVTLGDTPAHVIVGNTFKSGTSYVWCVRGGQGPDVQ